jgi:hypothetical protein
MSSPPDDKLRKRSLVKLRTLAAAHQSCASCAVECNFNENSTNNTGRVNSPSSASACDRNNNFCGFINEADSVLVPLASKGVELVVPQQNLRRDELLCTPLHQIINNHQPLALLRRSTSSLKSTNRPEEDGEMRTKTCVTFQDDRQANPELCQPATKLSLMQRKILSNCNDVNILANFASKNGVVTNKHRHGGGKRLSSTSERQDDATFANALPRSLIVQKMKHHRSESLQSIKDLSLLQLVSIAADVTATAADATACAAKSMRESERYRAMKHLIQEHFAPLQADVKSNCKEEDTPNISSGQKKIIYSTPSQRHTNTDYAAKSMSKGDFNSSATTSDGCHSRKHQVQINLAPLQEIRESNCQKSDEAQLACSVKDAEVDGENIGPTNHSDHNIYSAITNVLSNDGINGGNFGILDSEGDSVVAPSMGVKLVAPQSSLLRNKLVRQLQRKNRDSPQSVSTLSLNTKDSCQAIEVEDEKKKMGEREQGNIPCNVTGALERRVDERLDPLRRNRGSFTHAKTKNESEKKYVARLRKLAASHQALVRTTVDESKDIPPCTLNNFYSRRDGDDKIDSGVEVACLDALIDKPKGVDELCSTDEFGDGQSLLKQDAASVENDLIREKEDAIEELEYDYGSTAHSCNSMGCRENFSSFEGEQNTYLRKPRRLVSKLILKIKPSDLGKISDQFSDTSSSNYDSISAVYSKDQEKMYDHKMYTKMEWVSIPDDADSVAAKSALTASTDPIDIHDLTSWNFSVPSEYFRPIATARDCNYGHDLDSEYEKFGVEQLCSDPIDLDDVSVGHTSLATDDCTRRTNAVHESLVRLDDFGLDWLCGEVNHIEDRLARQPEGTLERMIDNIGNQVSDLLPCDGANHDRELGDGQTEFDGWTEFDGSIECFSNSIEDSTLCDDRATPIPNEALVKTSAIRLQSVLFIASNTKHPKLKKIFG